MKTKKTSILILLLVFSIVSCNKESSTVNQLPVLTTKIISEINNTTATCGGNITSDAGTAIIARGVCWSTTNNPTVADNKTTDGTGAGSFISNLTNLNRATTYYFRAYATNKNGTNYGNQFTFKTLGLIDIDGNVYSTIKIGSQEWMMENLRVKKLNDGTVIRYIDDDDWDEFSGVFKICCAYNEDSAMYAKTYGLLYDWDVANSTNLAPPGWHVPSQTDWTTLITFLGGSSIAGGKLKETGFTHWISPNSSATNSSGFTGLPSGRTNTTGIFANLGYIGYWWTSTQSSATKAYTVSLSNEFSNSFNDTYEKDYGFAIRCVKN